MLHLELTLAEVPGCSVCHYEAILMKHANCSRDLSLLTSTYFSSIDPSAKSTVYAPRHISL